MSIKVQIEIPATAAAKLRAILDDPVRKAKVLADLAAQGIHTTNIEIPPAPPVYRPTPWKQSHFMIHAADGKEVAHLGTCGSHTEPSEIVPLVARIVSAVNFCESGNGLDAKVKALAHRAASQGLLSPENYDEDQIEAAIRAGLGMPPIALPVDEAY